MGLTLLRSISNYIWISQLELLGRPAIVQLIQIASLFILTGALVNTATAAFTGLEKMHLNSVMLIVQSAVKTGMILALVVLGLGTLGAVVGFSIGVIVAGVYWSIACLHYVPVIA